MKNKMLSTAVLMASLSVIASGTMYLSKSANAGLLDSLMTSDLKVKSTDAKYALSVYGYNARVYEWTPEGNKNVTCVLVASNKSSGVACYDDVKDSKDR